MKKNISINISGVIFYIEEDCYTELKEYLAAIHQYFASYEDSREIIEDIEVRVAEIFCELLPQDKRVITQAEVSMLIATMGSISDFQDAEENPAYQTTFDEDEEEQEETPSFEIPTEDDFFEGGNATIQVQTATSYRRQEEEIYTEDEQTQHQKKEYQPEYEPVMIGKEQDYSESEKTSRRVFRDTKRKILGGVAAGLSHYIGLDPIWIRILLVISLTGFAFIPEAPATSIILYLIFWAVVPGNDQLEEQPQLRKLFRDPERNVIAGVSSGLATYLGTSELLIRVAFIASTVFFGTGIFLYMILWMIIPEANTLTEKMQMRGQAVNLNNIRASMQPSQAGRQGEEISTLHRAILFPFYIFSFLMNRIVSFLRPLVGFTAEFIRIVGGVTLVFTSVIFTASLIAILIAVLGWGLENTLHFDEVSVPLLKQSLPLKGNFYIFNAFFTLLMPTFFLGLFGVMMLSRRIIWNHKFGWSIAGLWFISMIGTGVTVGMVAQDFDTSTEIKIEENLVLPGQTLSIGMFEGTKNAYSIKPHLTIQGYKGDKLKLVQRFGAVGADHRQAQQNAKMLDYSLRQKGNMLLFGNKAYYKENAKYRKQSLFMTLYVPQGKTFKMKPELADIFYHTLSPQGYAANDLQEGKEWIFDEHGSLICKNCEENEDAARKTQNTEIGKVFTDFKNFKRVEVSGGVRLSIEQADDFQVMVYGKGREKAFDIEQHGETLYISLKGSYSSDRNTFLNVKMPLIEQLVLSGACFAKVNLKQQDDIALEMSGASRAMLQGLVKNLHAEIAGASQLEADKLKGQNAVIELSGASQADVNITEHLKADVSGASTLHYKGKPRQLETETSGFSRVKTVR